MATPVVQHPAAQTVETSSTAQIPHKQAGVRTRGFEIELSDGVVRQFESAQGIKEAILRGEIPRTSLIRVAGTSQSKARTVELWARSNEKLRSLYGPVWSLSMKGALVGFIVVGVLKALDTLVTLGSISPPAAMLWLLIGAAIFSPKWKMQLMAAAIFFGFKSGMHTTVLWGAWFGVAAFAAVFGVSAGMPVGTIVGSFGLNGQQQRRMRSRRAKSQ